MRKLFWLCLLLGGYVWMVTTENEEFVLQRGRALYKIVADWFQDAEVDFHLQHKKSPKKQERRRRWD